MIQTRPMTTKIISNLLAMVGLLVASLSSDSAPKDGLQYLAMAYISVDLGLRARAGYLRGCTGRPSAR